MDNRTADAPCLGASASTSASSSQRLGGWGNRAARAGEQDTTSFRRAELFAALQAEAARRGIVTEYGKRLTGLGQDGEQVTARFADGTSATADILVGADGIHSAVRAAIDPGAPAPRYTGLVSFGGFAPNPGLPPEPGLWKMAFSRRAFFGWFVPDRACDRMLARHGAR